MNDCTSISPPLLTDANAACIHEVTCPARAIGAQVSPFVSVRAAVTIVVGGGALIAIVARLHNFEVVTGLVVYTAISLPLLIAAIYSRVRQTTESQQRTVSLKDDTVTLAAATETESCPLQQCCWFRGKLTDDPSLSYQQMRGDAVLLVFRSGRVIACGLTPALYSQWIDALMSNRIRRVLRQEGAFGILMSIFIIAGFIGGACMGGSIGSTLQDALFPQRVNNPFANLLPAGLFILGGWLGAVVPLFVPGWRRHTDRERQQLYAMAIRWPAKVAIVSGALAGGNFVAGLILVLFFAALFLLLTRLVCRSERP